MSSRLCCKFGKFREDFISQNFAHAKFCEIEPSKNGKITLLSIDKGMSCLSREFFTSLICH